MSHAGEWRQQASIEAARDDRSFVTASEAESKIVEEARRAGDQAFQFDPNASPGAKAAQAGARVPANFHHHRKPKASGVVTDLDTSGAKPQYDLPSVDEAAALADPPGAIPNGDVQKANGQLPADENARLVEQSGWAPRFGSGTDADPQGTTLLDHQTWLEGKLDDKFFGDWYHNAAVIIFASLFSWLVAVLGGGLGWVFIIMAFCSTYYRTSIRRVRRNFRDDIERELAKTKLETDVESLEWINSFMVKFWPIYQPVLSQTVISSVDQVLSVSTPAFLDSLRLKTFTLGSKPPRLEHVKTYPKAEDDIVLMDWKFSFTPTDVEDFTARQLKNKINPKVVLEVRIGKAMVSKGLDVIVEDMAFSGLIRLKFKLQIPFPHVERIEFCFLEHPIIDYACKPLGGDLLGFDVNVVPGLQSFIQDQIHANLRPIMYAPNVFPIEVAKMLSGDAVDRAIGVLAVTFHGAQGLKNPDRFSGTPDPYVTVSLNNRESLGQTKTVHENANPRWNETKYVILTSLYDTLTLQVYDFNDYRNDKLLGTASFTLEKLQQDPEQENLQVEVMAGGKARGVLQADIRFFPVLTGQTLEDGTEVPAPESNTGVARFTVEQAKELDGSKSLIGQLNPYAVLLLNGIEVHATKKLKRTNNPIWPNPSKELLITDRKTAKLGVVIRDDRDLITDPILGSYQVGLDALTTLMSEGKEWFHLANAKTGRIHLGLQWKPVGLKGAAGGSGGYITPIGVMRIHFINAQNLRNMETLGKSDSYVRVLQSGVEKARTVTFKNNLDPTWDEVHYIPMHSERERLTLEVMDEESIGKDRSLGHVDIAAAHYVRKSEDGDYVEHSERRFLSDGLHLVGKSSPKGTLNYTISFYPCLDVADPEDEEETKGDEKEHQEASETTTAAPNEPESVTAQVLEDGETARAESSRQKSLPKLRLRPDDLVNYESGLIVFKLIEGDFSRWNAHLEVLIDDMRFPSHVSSRIKARHAHFEETGDTFVREVDVSRITLRLTAKSDNKSGDKDEHVIAKVTGDTLSTLKQCLNNPTVLTINDPENGAHQVKISMKYLPVKMKLDPEESINNMGIVRVDVLDAADLPSADRNGFSDPYCKFILNGKEVFKTSEQKKTLNPVWRQYFEVAIPSRIRADFKVIVYDWDALGNDDLLGSAAIDLRMMEPLRPRAYKLPLDGKSGVVNIRAQFRPDFVTRARQGSTTFSGALAPSKTMTGLVNAPMKGAGMVTGGVRQGASFFRFKKDKEKDLKTSEAAQAASAASAMAATMNANRATMTPTNNPPAMLDGDVSPSSPAAAKTLPAPQASQASSSEPKTPTSSPPHVRSTSFGAKSIASVTGGRPGAPEIGTANFTIISASGYPAEAKVRVQVKQLTGKGSKDVHKTKSIQASSGTGTAQYEHETFRVSCTAATQFQMVVTNHGPFRNLALGDGMFFVDDSSPAGGGGGEKTVRAGTGTVLLRSSFIAASGDSPGGRESSNNSIGSSGRNSNPFRSSILNRNPGLQA